MIPALVPIVPGLIGSSSQPSVAAILATLGLTTGNKLCLDAGDINSYASGQTWKDTSGNGSDFYRGSGSGSDSADPTFQGTPGNLSANEYFSVDGSDEFTFIGANPSWVNNMHKAAQTQTVLMWAYVASTGADSEALIADASGGSPGFGFYIRTTANLAWVIENGTTNDVQDSGRAVSTGAWHLLGVAVTNTNGSTTTWQIDGSSTTQTNSLAITPSASAAPAPPTIAAGISGYLGNLTNGSRIGAVMVWSSLLTGTNMTAIYNATKSRYGL